MSKIIPIKDLRDTNKISEMAHKNNEPIFVTKNGYSDLVVISQDYYDAYFNLAPKEYVNEKSGHYQPKDLHFAPLDQDFLGYVRVGCGSFRVQVGDVKHNLEEIEKMIREANEKQIKVLVFPELCLTGYTCGDLFYSNDLQNQSLKGLDELRKFSLPRDILFTVGLPLKVNNKLYNCAAIVYKGEILGVYAKKYLPHKDEYYEIRQFEPYTEENITISLFGNDVIFGNKFILQNTEYYKMCIGLEICEDLWAVNTPSTSEALAGANIILNLSASNEILGKNEYRKQLISSTSSRLVCSYVYSSCGPSESTTDLIYSGYKGIYENGHKLEESELFKDGLIYTDVDILDLENSRVKHSSFTNDRKEKIDVIPFSMKLKNTQICRTYPQNPFHFDENDPKNLLSMQSFGLKKRLEATHSENVVIGLSGGLDSALALIVCVKTFKQMGLPLKNIHAIILPAFANSGKTLTNARKLPEILGVNKEEINIAKSVTQHLEDINHDINDKNVTYENAQARERTQVLFDRANDLNALVVGTGDLSELCLGWTTYNGDHMSSYNVNVSVPKTLVKDIIFYVANTYKPLNDVLMDILNTPISPELINDDKNQITQLTESKIGPYELNDFFIYYYLHHNFSLKKILYIASLAFKGKYEEDTIKYYLKNFVKRFYINQFKRSTLPDGIKITSVSVSPRGDLRLPSDMSIDSLMSELD